MNSAAPTSAPSGCRWCGLAEREHFQRWHRAAKWHFWTPPTQEQIKQRMWSRRTARLNAAPAKYHATTGWAADHTGESGEPYCADCATDGCRPWQRIQARLDELRWGIPRRPRRSHQTASGWGGNHPSPF
ncbi:hypothetical protein [Streptomyces scabiei]|uniref:hypothetical protein n=1 Tax=Streptomyces scabiei TaxID=1930 RepID=UPI0038F69906